MNKIILLFAVLLIGFTACEKGPGPGGKATINITVVNGSQNVPYGKVYIKYGATSFPGENLTNYDESGDADDEGDVSFTNLTRGDYYCATTIIDSGITKYAGIHVLINNKPGEQHAVIDFAEEDPF